MQETAEVSANGPMPLIPEGPVTWDVYGPLLMAFGARLGVAVLVFLAFWVAAAIVRSAIMRVAARDALRRDALRLLAGGGRAVLLVFGAVIALSTLGLDVTAVIAGLGLTGFALGFALRDVLSSAVAGLLILLNRPFLNGDRIRVGDFEGTVLSTDLRYTLLDSGDRHFLVPNATVLNSAVTVITRTESPAEDTEPKAPTA